jgi:response regulator RpfG family c-di-GMP phosphodiesterase
MTNSPLIFIDDDIEDLALMKEMAMVIYFPSEVMTFDKPEAALVFLQTMQGTPLFILSDISMPRINGWELRDKMMRMEPRVTKAPFIFMSSSKTNEEMLRTSGLNIWAYYQKASSLTGMKEILENIMTSLKVTNSTGRV